MNNYKSYVGKNACKQFSDAISSNAESSNQESLLKQVYSNLMQSSPAVISQMC